MELNGAGTPVGAVACPVCTLYLREGISLQKHLDTHPKEQVIDALIKASASSLQTQQQQQQALPASAATSLPLSLQPQAALQTPTSIQAPQASSQVSQNTHISTQSPYPVGPIFECPPISTMMPPQFTSFSYQQFVNNGTMMIPQYAMAPQANQMMQMLYNPYGMYQQQIPTVQMISPVAAIPGATTRVRPVVTMTGENNVRTLTVPVNSPEPKQILPEILSETEPESGQVLPDMSISASPVLQNENTSIRSREESDNSTLPIDHRGQQTQSSTPPDDSTVQHEYNDISRSITIACTIDNTDNKVESVLPDMIDEEPSNNSITDLRCKSVTYEQPETQQFTQQIIEEGYVSISDRKTPSGTTDSVACERESEVRNDERSATCSSNINNNVGLSRDLIAIDALKDSVQSELNSVEKLENLITIMETELSNASLQKENNTPNDQERLVDAKEKTTVVDREESVIHDTIVVIPDSHEKDHTLLDIQEENKWDSSNCIANELRMLEKTCSPHRVDCSKINEALERLERTFHADNYKYSFSAPVSPVTRRKSRKIVRRSRSEHGSCENLSAYRHRVGFDDAAAIHDDDDDDDDDGEDDDEDVDEDEKIDEEDNFDEADMEIDEIPSPHTPFADCGVRSHTPLSTISGISVLRVRKDLSKPCSPTSMHSFHHVDSDSATHDEDSNGIGNIAEKDPIDCSQLEEEKMKTDHQHQETQVAVCGSVAKIQESSSSYAYHQSVITEHISSFPVIHSQSSVLMHESYSITTSTKTQNLLNLSESINPTTSTESRSFHSTKSLMPKQSMELLNINEDAHAGPMNVFEFDGLQILVPSTFISDSSQKAVSATSQQSMASSEGAIGIDEEVKSINMRADETMPPRGELSEQESNGCTEQSAWQVRNMYILS